MTDEIRDLVAKNTLVDWPRLEVIRDQLEKTRELSGHVAEVGVYKGGTALWISAHTPQPIFLFDTFEGMPEVSDHDLHAKGDFADTSLAHVSQLVPSAFIFKGLFPRDAPDFFADFVFSFVHLDVDIYTSVRDCLEFFWPRMVSGGVIILDDYNEPNCPGAKFAADKFAKKLGTKIIETVQSQAMVIK